MKPRRQRLLLLALVLAALALATAMVLAAFRDSLVFFFTPTQVLQGEAPRGRSFRIGGLVEAGSLVRLDDGLTVRFVVTDMARRVPVQYRGALPDLFKEGKGVVAQGRLAEGTLFVAEQVLAKHDENYMPPEAGYAMEQAARRKAGGIP